MLNKMSCKQIVTVNCSIFLELIADPFLATFAAVADQPDLINLIRSFWIQKLKLLDDKVVLCVYTTKKYSNKFLFSQALLKNLFRLKATALASTLLPFFISQLFFFFIWLEQLNFTNIPSFSIFLKAIFFGRCTQILAISFSFCYA